MLVDQVEDTAELLAVVEGVVWLTAATFVLDVTLMDTAGLRGVATSGVSSAVEGITVIEAVLLGVEPAVSIFIHAHDIFVFIAPTSERAVGDHFILTYGQQILPLGKVVMSIGMMGGPLPQPCVIDLLEEGTRDSVNPAHGDERVVGI